MGYWQIYWNTSHVRSDCIGTGIQDYVFREEPLRGVAKHGTEAVIRTEPIERFKVTQAEEYPEVGGVLEKGGVEMGAFSDDMSFVAQNLS